MEDELRLPTSRWDKRVLYLAGFVYRLWRVSVVLALFEIATIAAAAPWRVKLIRRLAAPFRPNAAVQERTSLCSVGSTNCILPSSSQSPKKVPELSSNRSIVDPFRAVTLQLRSLHRGPFAHHWVEVETSKGKVTIGFGPATVPFIDAGQISLQDNFGNIERISGIHPLPILRLPPLNYQYARAPDTGHPLRKPISLTIAHADAFVEKMRHPRFVVPYVPIFHDCRTFACTVEARAQGRSSLPCYLLFKGYW